jgi:arylsulfatase A-like enzyme
MAIGAALLALWGCEGCGSGETPRNDPSPANLVLLTIDTLRPDHLACYGYERVTSPRIDALAERGVLLANAFAPRGSTWPSLTSLHTGKYPATHGVRNNGETLSEAHVTLAQHLRARGYRTAAFLSNFRQAPNRGFDVVWGLEDDIGALKHVQPQYLWDEAITDRAVEWLRRESPDQPFFLWVHYMDPHEDYLPPPPFHHRFTDPAYAGQTTGRADSLMNATLQRGDLPQSELDHVLGLYDGQIASTDRLLGRVLDELEALGLGGSTLVVFTSDHGEELYQHNRYFFHAASIYDTVLRVPLVMSWPGHLPEGRRVESTVEIVDLVPTLTDLLGLDDVKDPALDGESLLPLLRGDARTRSKSHTFHEWSSTETGAGGPLETIFAVREGRLKLIENPGEIHPDNPPFRRTGQGFVLARRELYDLIADPGEKRNLLDQDIEGKWRAEADRLARTLEEWKKQQGLKATVSGEITEDMRRELKALGYLTDEDEDGK